MNPTPPCARLRLPLALASIWALVVVLALLAVPVLLLVLPGWHALRVTLAQLGLWQCWVSVLACVGLLALSRRRHAEHEEGWAQGALQVWVLGGLLSAVVLHYGALPQWLVQPAMLLRQAQVVLLLVVHALCAVMALRHLVLYRRTA